MPERSIEAVIFDVGGTLLRPREPYNDTVFNIVTEAGVDVTTEELHDAVQPATDELWRRTGRDLDLWANDHTIREFWNLYYDIILRELGVPKQDRPPLIQRIQSVYRRHDHWETYPETENVLRILHDAGYTLGVVSDWQTSLLELLDHLELTRYFAFVVASAIVKTGKPTPSMFREATRRAGVEAHEALFVGDLYMTDIVGSRAAGMHPVLVDRSRTPAPVDCDLIRDLDGLLPLLDRLNTNGQA